MMLSVACSRLALQITTQISPTNQRKTGKKTIFECFLNCGLAIISRFYGQQLSGRDNQEATRVCPTVVGIQIENFEFSTDTLVDRK